MRGLSHACRWSILELKEQRKRGEKGWFPKNFKRNLLQREEQ
ncbi:MAG: DUF4491 family protein [Tannerellaceae bacterium]|jgi:hypothetical protein|nr:DUF4491 family protein [Tannerellaceae bacterium]